MCTFEKIKEINSSGLGDCNERWKCRCQGCPSVSGLTHMVTVVHLAERCLGGKCLGGNNEFYLLHVAMNDYADFQEEIPNTWLHVWIRGPNRGTRCSPGCCCCFLVSQSCPKLWDSMDYSPPGSSVHRDSPGKNIGVGSHFLPQEIFPTQGLNLCLLNWQADSLPLCHQGSPQPRETEI